MSLNSKLLEAFQNFTFDDSEPDDKYFKDKLKKLKFDDYNDLMKRYIIEAASFGSVDMNEFDKDIDELLEKGNKIMPLANNERFVYKKNISTNKFVKVGVVDNYGFVEFYDNDKKVDVNSLGLYYPEFYVELANTKEIRQVTYKDGEIVGSKFLENCITTTYKKEFTPKNLPQQTISLVDSIFLPRQSLASRKPEEYYVTGYVAKEGRVYYYDQY